MSVLHDHALARQVQLDRVRDLERRSADHRQLAPRREDRPVRRAVGYQLIRLGARLAAEPSIQPARPR